MTTHKRVRLAAVVLVAAGLGAGFGSQWASADPPAPVAANVPAPQPEPPAKRREAVTRFPKGTFVKEFEVAPYGGGSLTFTYADDRVSSAIEVSVPQFGGEIELATESELAMSKNGVIYGIINSVRLSKLKLNPELVALPIGAGAYPLIEPLVNDTLVDVPFSYRCRVDGDRMVISNYRILASGPNPLGKLGGLAAKDGNLAFLSYFQILGTAIEGTYTLAEAKEPKPRRKGAK